MANEYYAVDYDHLQQFSNIQLKFSKLRNRFLKRERTDEGGLFWPAGKQISINRMLYMSYYKIILKL